MLRMNFRAYTSPLHPPVREWEPRNQMVATGDLNPYLKDKRINKKLYPVLNVSKPIFIKTFIWTDHFPNS